MFASVSCNNRLVTRPLFFLLMITNNSRLRYAQDIINVKSGVKYNGYISKYLMNSVGLLMCTG